MKDIQLQALNESILHWEENLRRVQEHKSPLLGEEHCACCKISDGWCGGCPIRELTLVDNCLGTPYYKVTYSLNTNLLEHHVNDMIKSLYQIRDRFIETM